MFKYQEDYQKVQELAEKHPELSIRDHIKKLGINPASYYRGKRASEGAKKPAKRKPPTKYAQIAAPAPVVRVPAAVSDQRMVFMMGTPDQIKAVLAGGSL